MTLEALSTFNLPIWLLEEMSQSRRKGGVTNKEPQIIIYPLQMCFDRGCIRVRQ